LVNPVIVHGVDVPQSGFVTTPPEEVATTSYPATAAPPTNDGAVNATVTAESPNETDVIDGFPATTGDTTKDRVTSDAAA
jgi:hypothetical protein